MLNARHRRTGAVAAGLGGLMGEAQAVQPFNMPVGVTNISEQVFHLHMLIFWICVAIGVVVFGAMFYSILRHRKSKGYKAAQFHESTAVEVVWTVVPFVILVAMAIPASRVLIEMYDTSNSDLTVKITGYQWKWKYDYLGQDISFYSNLATPRAEIYNQEPKSENYLLDVDRELILPTNQKIRFLLTADDVIHAWWVPDFATKKDAIPGFINEFWTKIEKPGVYRGQCAELCGRDHGFMPIVVRAVPPEQFAQWASEQTMKARTGDTAPVRISRATLAEPEG